MPRAVTLRSISGEPAFDLIEPGRVGRRVMEMDGRMRHQEGPHLLRFVGREIVHDDVHLAPSGLGLDDGLQKPDEFRARVASRGVAHHFARPCVQRRIERQRPVSVGLEAVPFGASGRQRQDRGQPIEGLNRRLFVDAEHHGVLRRIEIQADHVGGFRLELGIGRAHIPLESMGLQAGHVAGPARPPCAGRPVSGRATVWTSAWRRAAAAVASTS